MTRSNFVLRLRKLIPKSKKDKVTNTKEKRHHIEEKIPFCERLKTLRQAHHLTLNGLARQSNMAAQTIHQYENGQHLSQLKKFIALCHVLHVTPNELLGFEDSKLSRT